MRNSANRFLNKPCVSGTRLQEDHFQVRLNLTCAIAVALRTISRVFSYPTHQKSCLILDTSQRRVSYNRVHNVEHPIDSDSNQWGVLLKEAVSEERLQSRLAARAGVSASLTGGSGPVAGLCAAGLSVGYAAIAVDGRLVGLLTLTGTKRSLDGAACAGLNDRYTMRSGRIPPAIRMSTRHRPLYRYLNWQCRPINDTAYR